MTEKRNSISGILKGHDLPDMAQEQEDICTAADSDTADKAVTDAAVEVDTESAAITATAEAAAVEKLQTSQPNMDSEPNPAVRRGFKYFLRDILSVVVSAVIIALLLKSFVVDNRSVPTGSMIPTINVGDRVIMLKFSYLLGKTPARQDVVVFAPPEEFESGDDLLKRVIGLPGDTVEVKDGLVYVNGEALEEPYINELPKKDYAEVTVPEGCYFMLGDNRNHSRDSREWNDPYVPCSDIKGKVVICYWPVSNLRMVR